MADLALLTVRKLRELARAHLGPRGAKLKTKAELVAALSKLDPALLASPEPAAVPPTTTVELAGSVVVEEPLLAAEQANTVVEEIAKSVATERLPTPVLAPPAAVPPRTSELLARPENPPVKGPSKRASEKTKAKAADVAAASSPVASAPVASAAVVAAPPVLSPEARFLEAEGLGELPLSYGTDSLTLLARDPRTLHASWDLAPETAARARAAGAEQGVLVLERDGRPYRDVHVVLEARSWWLHAVAPGASWKARLELRGRDGALFGSLITRDPASTPPEGPSPRFGFTLASHPPSEPLAPVVLPMREPLPAAPAEVAASAAAARPATRGGSAVAPVQVHHFEPGDRLFAGEERPSAEASEQLWAADDAALREEGLILRNADESDGAAPARSGLGSSDQLGPAWQRPRVGGHWSSSRSA